MLTYAWVALSRLTYTQWLLLGGIMLGAAISFLICSAGRCTKQAPAVGCVCWIYSSLILWLTLCLRETGSEMRANLIPLWSWHQGFILDNDEIRWQIYYNVLLFVPFGLLIYFSGRRSLRRVLLAGFLLSLFIEVCQYILCLGLFEWDDMLHNSLGCFLGGFAAKTIERVWNLHRLHKTSGRNVKE